MSAKLTGISELTARLNAFQKALGELDGELGSVTYDPEDPSSIQNAISGMEALVDERTSAYAGDELVDSIIDEVKESFRKAIIDQAAEYRLKGVGE